MQYIDTLNCGVEVQRTQATFKLKMEFGVSKKVNDAHVEKSTRCSNHELLYPEPPLLEFPGVGISSKP